MELFEDFIKLNGININNPQFEKTQKVHDWRNYVPYNWQKNWTKFTVRERHIIAVMSQMAVDKEGL